MSICTSNMCALHHIHKNAVDRKFCSTDNSFATDKTIDLSSIQRLNKIFEK